MKRGNKILTTVNLNESNYNYLVQIAKDDNRSVSNMLDLIIEFYSNFSKNIKSYK